MHSLSFVYQPGRMNRLEAARRGESPSEFFYGALELEKQGLDVRVIEADPATQPHWPSAALNLIGQIGPIKLDGHVMQAAWDALPLMEKSDMVVGTTGANAFALALLKCLGRHSMPVVGIQCGLLNHRINALRRWSSSALLRRMDSVLFGGAELKPMMDAYPGIEGHLHVNEFGVDTRFWTPGPAPETGYVLAVGNDWHRDFETLMNAARKVDVPFVVVTRRDLPGCPSNVHHRVGSFAEGVSDAELRELYRGATCVVTPLKRTMQPSGQSVTLQAMSCGRPVVLTNTPGLWSADTVRDGETLLLTPVSDADAMAGRIREILDDSSRASRLGEAARESVCRYAPIENFARRLLAVCQHAVERGAGP